MKVLLYDICHGRSGDKGDTVNIGIIARHQEVYPFIEKTLTVARVVDHFAGMITGPVERYELPNIGALNFLLHGALGGGGTKSLKNDAQGKTFAAALLRMEVDIPESLSRYVKTKEVSGVR